MKKIGVGGNEGSSANKLHGVEQPPAYPKQETQTVSQYPPRTPKASETVNVMIVKESHTTGKI